MIVPGRKIFQTLSPPPMELQIGITDYCNLRCLMCMHTAHEGIYGSKGNKAPPLHGGHLGFMDLNLFKKILDDIKKAPFRLILMHWLGESLLHPQFDSLLHLLAEANDRHRFTSGIMLFTNTTLLTPEMSDNILPTLNRYQTPFFLVYSLDATTPDTFMNIKRERSFDSVLKNIDHILNRNYGPWLHHVFRFLVMKENEHEALQFVQYWQNRIKKLGGTTNISFDVERPNNRKQSRFTINLKKVASSDPVADRKRHLRVIEELRKYIKEPLAPYTELGDRLPDDTSPRPPCPAPLRTPVVNWDGQVTVCCPDSEMELAIGSFQDSTFNEMWFGSRARYIRHLHLNGEMNRLPRCARCGNLPALPMTPDELQFFQDEQDYYKH